MRRETPFLMSPAASGVGHVEATAGSHAMRRPPLLRPALSLLLPAKTNPQVETRSPRHYLVLPVRGPPGKTDAPCVDAESTRRGRVPCAAGDPLPGWEPRASPTCS